MQPNGSNPAGNTPQAFLTAIFFDERFNMIPAADGGVSQQQSLSRIRSVGIAASVGSNGSVLTLTSIKAPKNGYVYIYISNQSNNDVYFDNLQAGIVQGNIAEKNHYYAYGLKIATLSSKKLGDSYEGSLKNNYLYQGAYSELDEDIGWHDFALRNYDAQIGRWVQQDPYQEFASPYVGIGDDPINLTDPSGGSILDGLSGVGRVAVTTLGGAIIGLAVDLISGGDGGKGLLIGSGVGLIAGLGSLTKHITLSMCINTVNLATTAINTSVTTWQAGKVNHIWNSVGTTFTEETKGNNEIYVIIDKIKTLITSVDISGFNFYNRWVLKKIFAYYANSVGASMKQYGGKGKLGLSENENGKSSSDNPAFTDDQDIYINDKDDKIATSLSNINSTKSILLHEKFHQDDNTISGFEGNLYTHAKVYLKQIRDNSFKLTLPSFQLGVISSLANYIMNAIESGIYSARGLLNDFNNTNGQVYKITVIEPTQYSTDMYVNIYQNGIFIGKTEFSKLKE